MKIKVKVTACEGCTLTGLETPEEMRQIYLWLYPLDMIFIDAFEVESDDGFLTSDEADSAYDQMVKRYPQIDNGLWHFYFEVIPNPST